jgi:hypothetical protein
MTCVELIRCFIDKRDPFEDGQSIIFCSVSSYESLFWNVVRQRFASQGYSCEVVNAMRFTKAEFCAHITSSFLGMAQTLIVISYHEGKLREFDRESLSLLKSYQGPHRLLVMLSPSQARDCKHHNVIEMPSQIDRPLCSLVIACATGERASEAVPPCESFDQACMFGIGSSLVGKQGISWLTENLMPESQGSLFLLVQHLLSREAQQFYQLWPQWKTQYPDEFWISFWGDRLWQAYLWITAQKNAALQGMTSSLKGLPFRFMKSDWRHIKVEQCTQALEYLYAGDYQLKNGCSITPFERMFHLFFA